MKKILITIIGVILLILLIVCAVKGINIGKISVLSITGLRDKSFSLDKKIEEANEEINQNYAKTLKSVKDAETRLETAKEEYESKVAQLSQNSELGVTQIEKYKIEYLWGIIGNYAKKENLKVDMNIEETSIKDTYNINFSLYGSYVGITNFLYSIENDDELNYKINDFKVEPSASETQRTNSDNNSSKTTETNNVKTDAQKLKATFTVPNIIINFN